MSNDLGTSLEDLLPNSKSNQDEESTQSKLKQKMQEINLKEKEQETEAQAQISGLPYINLVGFPISPDALSLIDRDISKKLEVICFLNTGKDIRLGTLAYSDEVKKIEQEIKEKYFSNVSTYLISKNSFTQASKLYDSLPKVRKFVGGVEIKEEDLNRLENDIKNFHQLDELLKKANVTEMVTVIIAAAIKSRASDIHIEGEESDIKVRYRIDGVLNDVASMDKTNWSRVISRIKQLSKLKINISDRPQDGRFSIYMKDDRIDVRVSCLPTAFGESVVMRLLRASFAGLTFEELGIRGQAMEILAKEIARPNGMIVTTGPTGSGKTTSLYAILRRLNNPQIKIITIEDPIEYELKGINQSQTNDQYTFAKGLRSIVRQDPDIVMVGEIRDLETAEIAIQAALTGHLVLSTIHTNDAFGAIPRFLSMGAKPFLLAPALNVSIGQRLVRKICESCKKEIQLEADEMEKVKKLLESLPPNSGYMPDMDNMKFYMGAGCDECQGIGYKGRIGIFEIMPINEKMKQTMTMGNVSEYDIKKMAFEDGIITMAQDGILKALDGLTSIKEVFRVAE
ncbi:MAG: GspE/PulE family protein [Patescibacteria group bacterium]|jgi:type IV pilus assembly protein PilB